MSSGCAFKRFLNVGDHSPFWDGSSRIKTVRDSCFKIRISCLMLLGAMKKVDNGERASLGVSAGHNLAETK